MKRYIAILAIAVAGALPFVGSDVGAVAAVPNPPARSASCIHASTPGGVKCLQSGEPCSHKPGYQAAYHRAGFKCKMNGRLEEI